jgi:riboflavin biosynthesis pyrimidine reductase
LLRGRGAELLPFSTVEGMGIPLEPLLEELGRRGITTVMVEGGASVIGAFLTQGLADFVILTIAPLFVGGLRTLESPLQIPFPRLDHILIEQLGEDVLVCGRIKPADLTSPPQPVPLLS